MKLTKLLTQIILEDSGSGIIPVTKFVYDGYLINLTASYHQWNERQGLKSLEEIVNIYEYNAVYKEKYYDRVGVPNRMIKEIFTDNFEIEIP